MIVSSRKIKSFVMLRCCFLNSFSHPLTLHDAKFITSHLSFCTNAKRNILCNVYTRMTDIVVIIVVVGAVYILSFLNKFCTPMCCCLSSFHSFNFILFEAWQIYNIYIKTLVSHLSKCGSGSQLNECQEVEKNGTPTQVKHCDESL